MVVDKDLDRKENQLSHVLSESVGLRMDLNISNASQVTTMTTQQQQRQE